VAVLVKIPQIHKWNQQVTNGRSFSSHLVGTSETTRATSFDKKETIFNQWLAGLIDGDGCFLKSKTGYSSCEITVALEDERMLRIIQNKLGGAIKARSGVKAIRWRLHNRPGMLDLVNRINGYIRHNNRLLQLNQVCVALGLQLLSPDTLHKEHGWFAGFF
jgi:ubiquinol-cytochrome c reductase cytochrome b subunit